MKCLIGVVLLSVIMFVGSERILAEESSTVLIYDVESQDFKKVERIDRDDAYWKSVLTSEQYYITNQKGTEKPYSGAHLKENRTGVFQCVRCGTDLFSSETKYDSKTGWPSFWKPVAEENVRLELDHFLFYERIEVLCARCGAHLGHVFDDGPEPTGKRWCINSAALRFKQA